MAISDWPLAERPRERLLENGARTLSDADLLAVVLRTGVAGKSAVDLGRELLSRFKGIVGLLASDLSGIKGIGPAKRAHLEAAIELARRSIEETLKAKPALTSPGAVRDFLGLTLNRRQHEVFVCIWLDAQHRVIKTDEAFEGT